MSERDDAVTRWREAENRLYPVVTVRPELYEAAIGVVRSLADHLGRVPDQDALVTSYLASTTDGDLAAAGIDRESISPELEVDVVRDAAYQIRARELAQRAQADGTALAILRARKSGDATAVLWAQGNDELAPPYRNVEMSLATGFAVSVSTEYDPDTLGPLYVLEGFQLDPETGTGAQIISPRQEFTDADAWRSAATTLRQSLLTP
jgi:hypothetical protein